jgi:hypothetical protein
MNAENEKPPAGTGGNNKGQTALINFLNILYDKAEDISILKKYVNGPYSAIFCDLAKTKLKQVELQRKGGPNE